MKMSNLPEYCRLAVQNICSSPHSPAVRMSFCIHTSPLPLTWYFPLSSFGQLLGIKEYFVVLLLITLIISDLQYLPKC